MSKSIGNIEKQLREYFSSHEFEPSGAEWLKLDAMLGEEKENKSTLIIQNKRKKKQLLIFIALLMTLGISAILTLSNKINIIPIQSHAKELQSTSPKRIIEHTPSKKHTITSNIISNATDILPNLVEPKLSNNSSNKLISNQHSRVSEQGRKNPFDTKETTIKLQSEESGSGHIDDLTLNIHLYPQSNTKNFTNRISSIIKPIKITKLNTPDKSIINKNPIEDYQKTKVFGFSIHIGASFLESIHNHRIFTPSIGLKLSYRINQKWKTHLEVNLKNYGNSESIDINRTFNTNPIGWDRNVLSIPEFSLIEFPIGLERAITKRIACNFGFKTSYIWKTSNSYLYTGQNIPNHIQPTYENAEDALEKLLRKTDLGIYIGLKYAFGSKYSLEFIYNQGLRDLTPNDYYMNNKALLNSGFRVRVGYKIF